MDRADTRFIAIRDTLTKNSADIDVRKLDERHCKQGRLGIGWHFLILTCGSIQLGRGIKTCGSHSINLDRISVAAGIVGGLDDEGSKAFTRNDAQQASLTDLIAFLQSRYPDAEVNDRPVP